MNRRMTVLILTAFSGFSCIAPVYADNETPSDYQMVVQASETSELDYEKLKKKLFERYAPVIEQMEQAENNYTSVFSNSATGGTGIGSGSIPEEFSPWWQAQVNGQINQAVPNISTDITSLFTRTLEYSSQIQVFSDLPLIRETTIQEAEGPYDFRLFA